MTALCAVSFQNRKVALQLLLTSKRSSAFAALTMQRRWNYALARFVLGLSSLPLVAAILRHLSVRLARQPA